MGFSAHDYARSVLRRHTHGFMSATHFEPDSNNELLDTMLMECADILTGDLLNGELTPMQYNDTRNCLAEMLWDVFQLPIQNEEEERRRSTITEVF